MDVMNVPFNLNVPTILAITVTVCVTCVQPAFAGGSGSAESDILFIDGRYMSLHIATDPPILEGGEEYVALSVTLMDADLDPPEPIPDVAYSLEIKNGDGNTLLELDAYSPGKSSTLNVIPDAEGVEISGETDAIGTWLASPDSPLMVRAPLFLEGGIVDILVTVRSIGAEPIQTVGGSTFETAFSMGERIPFTVDIDGTPTDLEFVTYFDRIDKFVYDERQRSITATMPFEWDAQFIKSFPFVHAEYYIPKTAEIFENHEILLAVNGISYFGTVDRSGDDEIVVHFLISSTKMLDLLGKIPEDARDTMTFEIKSGKERQKERDDASLEAGDTVVILSSQEDWKFYVSLTPKGKIVADSAVAANIEFRDPVTNIVISLITYDIDVLFSGQSTYAERGREARDGTDSVQLRFEEAGAAIVRISNVNSYDTSGEFAFQVSEQNTAPDAGDHDPPSGGGAGTPPADGSEAGPDHLIEMALGSFSLGCERDNSCFEPFALDAHTGQTVSWINLDGQGHTVASGVPSEGPDGTFESPVVGEGDTYEHTFDTAGTFEYFCTLHPWMVGIITVSEYVGAGSGGDGIYIAIPGWVKSSAGWWSDGLIGDAEFVGAIEWMIANGVITL